MSDDKIEIDVAFIEVFRDCFLQLCLQRGAVYIDFDETESYEGKTLSMVRMSFDGYGCCTAKGNPMPKADADALKRAIPEEDIAEASAIIERYIRANRHLLWEDALVEHGLL
mmetsp:Transcript_22671/g.33135  ORF Transcript_22671/g.33135 Transcript_22671/m.33135 type:complete len:112 (+) Transcript_22671:40-375(+)|eukprot:CAMPEP_0185019820 /NCGR_PEP_ID=MMETSP1103-20130426/2393_1 /TAXON_ID=36769 /ORGANISM="Paraphysomonas bandaiensis, Strain Caron Lab Isolate" /LENGTH=111 /DNA_ID=CAMNT_0027550311 /DNA_START=40 /DNA_END=375 /DNA_ORIENTATION=-